jgi:hypothetical protein
MNIDFKVTDWERIEIPEKLEKQVMTEIKNNKINNSDDLQMFFDKHDFVLSIDSINSPTESMTPEENGGCSTVEVFNESDGNIIWQNGI